MEYLLFSAGDTFAIVVAFFRAAARLSTFVGRPWSPRCCDNLRTCEVRGINHISPFFDWGLGFSHVGLANSTYYYLVLKVRRSRNRIVEQPAVLQRVPKAMPMQCAPIQCSMYILLFVLFAHVALVLTRSFAGNSPPHYRID